MKILVKSFLAFSLFISLSLSSYSQKDQISIKGEVVNSSEKISESAIHIYENGKFSNTIVLNKNTFDYVIPKNKEVMLEFEAPGHYTKRIAFDSNLDSHIKKVPRLDLKMTLIEKNDEDNCEEIRDLLDMPTAFITYNKEREYYDKNLKYSLVIKKGISRQMASK